MIGGLETLALTVVKLNKKCKDCGHLWHGNFFQEWVVNAPKEQIEEKQYVLAYCDSCIEGRERQERRRQIEFKVESVDRAIAEHPTRGKLIFLLAGKVRALKQYQGIFPYGGLKWNEIRARIDTTKDRLDALSEK